MHPLYVIIHLPNCQRSDKSLPVWCDHNGLISCQPLYDHSVMIKGRVIHVANEHVVERQPMRRHLDSRQAPPLDYQEIVLLDQTLD